MRTKSRLADRTRTCSALRHRHSVDACEEGMGNIERAVRGEAIRYE